MILRLQERLRIGNLAVWRNEGNFFPGAEGFAGMDLPVALSSTRNPGDDAEPKKFISRQLAWC